MSGRLTILFQYRKRYSPVQRHVSRVKTRELRFQYRKRYSPVQLINIKSSSMRIVFQYRKRYSPVQHDLRIPTPSVVGFNTASGIRLCNAERAQCFSHRHVSIPQAVFACATEPNPSRYSHSTEFQYRKRYSPVQRRNNKCTKSRF